MSPPGVEPVLPSWKVGVVTASPPSWTLLGEDFSFDFKERNASKKILKFIIVETARNCNCFKVFQLNKET